MQFIGRSRKKEPKTDEQKLLEDLFAAKTELEGERQRFDYLTEPEMVASCIYQMRALQEKYSYLLGCVREKEISLEDRKSFIADREEP